MAFLPPEQQNQQTPQGQTQAGSMPPPQIGGSVGGGPTGGAKTSAGGTPTQFGSSASKLGDYLTANAPQIQNQANQVSGNLNSQYGQIQGDITNAANQFGQAVQGGYAAPNQGIVDQAFANPTQFASTPENVKAFQGQYNDQYSGPTSYESSQPYGAIQGEVNQAVQNAGLLNSQAGLQNYFAKNAGPNATQASNTLDTLLLQGNPQAQQQIQQAAGQFGNLTNQFGQSTQTADQSVKAAQDAAQQAKQYAQQQAGNYTQNFGNTLNQQVTDAQARENAYNNIVNQNNQYLGQARPILSDINAYASKYGQTLPQNVAQYLGANQSLYNTPANINNAATADQVATAQALSQLLGTGYQNPITDASQAGTLNIPTANALAAPNVRALELQGLTPTTQQLFSKVYGNSPVGQMYNTVGPESNLLAGQAGSTLNGQGVGQGQDYENMLAQLAGFNNGAVSTISGFPNYYQVNP